MSDLAELRFFDLGLAKGREIGAEETITRILETLESNATGEYKKVMLTPKLISEIKGEQK